MQYWSEMDSKWGFSDGEAVPSGIEHYRKAYLITMNTLLERNKSSVRVIAFDRGGCHNWCLFLRVPVDAYREMIAKNPKSIYEDQGISIRSPLLEEPPADKAYYQAQEQAHELYVDEHVYVEVSLDRGGLEKALTQK